MKMGNLRLWAAGLLALFVGWLSFGQSGNVSGKRYVTAAMNESSAGSGWVLKMGTNGTYFAAGTATNGIAATDIDTSAELFGILTDETGSAAGALAVFSKSPVIETPTIASLVNMNHTHLNAAGGGTLDAAAIASGVFPIARLATGTPDGTKFVRDDGTLAVPAGSGGGTGDVTGPASSTNNNVAIFSGTGGKTLKDSSGVQMPGGGAITTAGTITAAAIVGSGTAAGSITLGDGGSHTFRVSPPTITTDYNLIPAAAPSTGFWLETLSGTTNGTITKVGSTGTGNVVRDTSPTIVTPTVASFANATHNHQNAAGGGALDAAAITSGVLAIGRLATGTPDGTKFVRDDGTLATPAGGGSTIGYQLKFGGADTSSNPANGGFTYYSGGTVYAVPTTSFTNQCVPIFKTGTIKGIGVRVRVDGTLGSSENVTFKISINGAAGTGTGVVMPLSAINNLGTSTSESIAVTAGQTIALTYTTPTWATPPTTCYFESWVYIE